MRKLVLLLMAVLLCGLVLPVSQAADERKLPKWLPDKTQLTLLEVGSKVGRYQLRAPKGYQPQARPAYATLTGCTWTGTARDDNSRPYLMLLIFTPPAGAEDRFTLEQLFAQMLSTLSMKRDKWQQSPTEAGLVNGMMFLRAYWAGIDKDSGHPMKGFCYMAQDGKTFVQLSSQEYEPHDKTALPLAEAAALTLQKP